MSLSSARGERIAWARPLMSEPERVQCPNPACGHVNPLVARYCSRCGGELVQTGKVASAHNVEVRQGCLAKLPDDLAGPWQRWTARYLDYCLSGLVVGFSVAVVETLTGLSEAVAVAVLLSLLITLIWVPIEAVLLTTIGTTPGKWISGLRIVALNSNHERPQFRQSLWRATIVSIKGVGLGIPILSLVAQGVSFFALNSRDFISWDESTGIYVAGRPGPLRFGLSCFLLAVLLFGGWLAWLLAWEQK